MNEFITSHKKVIIVIGCIIVFAVGWILYNYFTARNDRSISDGLADIERQQQSAGKDIESVKTGITDSQGVVGSILSSIEHSTATANSIYNSNSNATATANSIAESNSGTKEQLTTATAGNGKATESISRAEELVEQCQQLNQSSQSIFDKYKQGNNTAGQTNKE